MKHTKITDKIDLEVIVLGMDKFGLENMSLHTHIRLRHVTSLFCSLCVTKNKIQDLS